MSAQFEPVPNTYSDRVRCVDCGAQGYDIDPDFPRSWKAAHLRGHAPCPRCGKLLTLLKNGQARTHGKCPMRGKGRGA